MSDAPQPIPPDAYPRLPHGVRLVHNEAQGGLVLLAPERIFKPDAISVAILQRCTGEKTFGQIIGERVEGMLKHYDFVTAETLSYFTKRPPQAARDSEFALDYVKRHAVTPEAQQSVLAALEFKCDVLWAQLDALYHAYVAPRHVSPGAFIPADQEQP